MRSYVFRKRILLTMVYIRDLENLSATVNLYDAVQVEERNLSLIDLEYLARHGFMPVELDSISYFDPARNNAARLFVPPVNNYRPKVKKHVRFFSPDEGIILPRQHVEPIEGSPESSEGQDY